jgi:5-bromo-4-chloroindolyl phosphate hydrolysis protein
MNVVVLSALTDRNLLVYSHTGVIVLVLVSLLLFFVVCQWAMIKLCNNNTALHYSLERAASTWISLVRVLTLN